MKRSSPQFSNFHDPLGLVRRMLQSMDRAAYAALVHAGLEKLLKPVDLAMQPYEKRRLREAQPSRLPILLIVGAPRSGTTLVYQVLSRYLPVTYFTNLCALFPHSPITASKRLGCFLRHRQADFHSFYGNTAGLTAPNDGFHLWNRWLGSDRYRAPDCIDQQAADKMQSFFNAWLTTFGRPLLNKNNRNTDCVSLLASILNNAFFIIVRRDPVFVAQSLMIARQRIQGSQSIGWGLRSRSGSSSRDPLGYIDDVCDQILEIETRLTREELALGRDRFFEISYERFCADPGRFVQKISHWIWNTGVKDDRYQRELKPFQVTNARLLDRDEFARIEFRLRDLRDRRSESVLPART